MTLTYYDRQGNPIPMGRAVDLLCDIDYVNVARHFERGYIVSTAWLGLDYATSDAPPVIFETMIFGPSPVNYCERYSTESAALAGHQYAIKWLRRYVLDQDAAGGTEKGDR